MAKPAAPSNVPEISALEDQLEQARRTLGVEAEKQIKPKRLAQWFNWPNWDNWPNWNNWGNWANWVNW